MTGLTCGLPDKCAYTVSKTRDSIKFWPCGRVSYNPNDVINHYCAACNRFLNNRLVTLYGEIRGSEGVPAGMAFNITVYGTWGADSGPVSGKRADTIIVDDIEDQPIEQGGPPAVSPSEKTVPGALDYVWKDGNET